MTIQTHRTNWEFCLRRVFGDVGVILVTQISSKKGAWKLGKTDISLLLSEYLLHLNLVSEVATNINTYGTYPQIADLFSLRQWLFRNRRTKLYIFDEINKHLPRRRPMSRKNIGVLQVFPEISKAKARLIMVGQDLLSVDREILREIWTRGVFVKVKLESVELISSLLDGKQPFTVPKTSIPFNPYETAPFTEKADPKIMFKDEDLRILWNWAREGKWRDYFKHPQECNRFVRRNVIKLLEKHYQETESHTHNIER